eukprot:TRINITY_DN10066_c0_g1_i1.p1 TRINITY_DN10066_c0_g1~~TRINITY_DN10066_c0_g1_i1.p1  ORF type:complete len:324 (-),score=37.15 TRINITY_DN10066_c0_g1_i1:19-969(-)
MESWFTEDGKGVPTTDEQVDLSEAWLGWIRRVWSQTLTNVKCNLHKKFIASFYLHYEIDPPPQQNTKKELTTEVESSPAEATRIVKLTSVGVKTFHEGRAKNQVTMMGNKAFVKVMCDVWPECNPNKPSVTVQQAALSLYWGALLIRGVSMDKDSSTNRNLVVSYINTINGWRSGGQKFGIGITRVISDLKIGKLAKERFEQRPKTSKPSLSCTTTTFLMTTICLTWRFLQTTVEKKMTLSHQMVVGAQDMGLTMEPQSHILVLSLRVATLQPRTQTLICLRITPPDTDTCRPYFCKGNPNNALDFGIFTNSQHGD